MRDKLFTRGNLADLGSDLALLPDKRWKISKIKGELVKDINILRGKDLVCVGDRVTRTLLEAGLRPRVAVIDLREKREADPSIAYLLDGFIILTARNPPGRLTREAWNKFARALELSSRASVVLLIEGEEDLLGFPAVILSPDDWILTYGQPDVGMVIVRVDERTREEALELLEEAFIPI